MNNSHTKIENTLLEALIRLKVSKSELQIILVLIRKLNGFHKDQDQISISQFMELTGLSNRAVIDGLKQLELMKICSQVEKGLSRNQSSVWYLEQDVTKWEPMKRCSLVKFPVKKPVNISSHTKETITKDIDTKVSRKSSTSKNKTIYGNEIINKFKDAVRLANNGNIPVGNSDNKTRQVYWNILQKLGVKNGWKTYEELNQHQDVIDNINSFFVWLRSEYAYKNMTIENVYTLKQKLNYFLENIHAR